VRPTNWANRPNVYTMRYRWRLIYNITVWIVRQ